LTDFVRDVLLDSRAIFKPPDTQPSSFIT